jgi:hypothetical protein
MRYYLGAFLLLAVTVAGLAAYFVNEWQSLRRLCMGLPIGASVAQVRESAAQDGFRSSMLPGTQMVVEPRFWFHSPAPHCLAAFNASTHTLEQRFWQPR